MSRKPQWLATSKTHSPYTIQRETFDELNRFLYLSEIWSKIFDELLIDDIMQLSRTCRRLHGMAETYWNSHICLSRIIGPYVSSVVQIEEFREMMHMTGAIISGSSALQVFAWAHYDESDLDLYVEASRSQIVSSFLINLGYSKLETTIGMKDGLDPGDGYPGKTEIQQVESYRKEGWNRIIQLINTV